MIYYLHIGLHKTGTKFFQHKVFPNLPNTFCYNPDKLTQLICDLMKADDIDFFEVKAAIENLTRNITWMKQRLSQLSTDKEKKSLSEDIRRLENQLKAIQLESSSSASGVAAKSNDINETKEEIKRLKLTIQSLLQEHDELTKEAKRMESERERIGKSTDPEWQRLDKQVFSIYKRQENIVKETYRLENIIKEISKEQQVLCITHQPFLAAGGLAHFKVNKNVIDGITYTSISKLTTKKQRKYELIELIGGGFGEANDYASRLLDNAAA